MSNIMNCSTACLLNWSALHWRCAHTQRRYELLYLADWATCYMQLRGMQIRMSIGTQYDKRVSLLHTLQKEQALVIDRGNRQCFPPHGACGWQMSTSQGLRAGSARRAVTSAGSRGEPPG